MLDVIFAGSAKRKSMGAASVTLTFSKTDHDDFKDIKISSFTKMKNPILIDTRGIIDPSSAKLEKIIFRGLGRGNF